ncbi:MAG: Ig-like domain-containing protein [Lachnospiraceae bacterium]
MKSKGIAIILIFAMTISNLTLPASAAKLISKANKITITNKADIRELYPGDTCKVKVKQKPNGAKDTIIYRTSNKKVVKVTPKGILKAISPGTATIKATAKRGKVSQKITVSVIAIPLTAAQTGSHSIVVTGEANKLKKDIVLTKNGTRVAYTKELSADGKTAVLTTVQQIIDSQYNIIVGNESTVFQGQEAVATKVEFLSDKLTLNGYPSDATGAQIRYHVLDQFGGDMTNKIELTAYCALGTSIVDKKNGIITVKGYLTRRYLGKTTTISIFSNDYSKSLSETAEVTVSECPVIQDISMQLYQKNNEPLTDDFTGKKDFYLIFTLKDQYGNEYHEQNITNTNVFKGVYIYMPANVTKLILETGTDVTTADRILTETITVDEIKYPAVRLVLESGVKYATKGETVARAHSDSGASASCKITVEHGITIDSLKVTGSDPVVQGRSVEFAFEALDAYGNEVTKLSAYRALLANNQEFGKHFRFAKEDGVIKLYHRANSSDELGIHNMIVVTPKTNTYTSFTYTVLPKPRPTEIVGIKKAATGIVGDDWLKFTVKRFIINDQYGNPMSNNELYEYKGIYTIAAFDPIDANSFWFKDSNVLKLSADADIKIKLNYKNQSRNIVFRICDASGQEIEDLSNYPLAGLTQNYYDKITKHLSSFSEYMQEMIETTADKVSDFKVDKIKTIYYQADLNNSYSEEVDVSGMIGKNKIKLTTDDYAVVFPAEGEIPFTDGKGKVGLVFDEKSHSLYCDIKESDFIVNGQYVNKLKRTIHVVISADADNPIPLTINICKDAPAIAKATLETTSGTEIKELTVTKGELHNFSTYLSSIIQNNLRYTDQYGASDKKTDAEKVSFLTTSNISYKLRTEDIESNRGAVYGNGTNNLTFEDFETGDECKLIIEFSGGVSLSLILIVTD